MDCSCTFFLIEFFLLLFCFSCCFLHQNKSCVQTLEGHAQNVSAVAFHPELPLIITGSEDGTVRVWHANTYRLETTLNYGLERVWCIAHTRSSNNVAIGYDEGSIMIKVSEANCFVQVSFARKNHKTCFLSFPFRIVVSSKFCLFLSFFLSLVVRSQP